MNLSWMQIYLLAGLLFHKAVWEYMKRRSAGPPPEKRPAPLLSRLKIVILLGIIGQTLFPEILPVLTFQSPALRMIGLALYTAGLGMAVTARIQLGRNWSDIEKSYVKRDHALVAHGLYRYVRHPIYAGDLLLLLGLELALNSYGVLGVGIIAVYVRGQAIREERKLRQSLPGYQQYYERTSRFLPFLPV